MITKTVSELAEICGAALEGDGRGTIVGPASLSDAEPNQVSFLGNPRYAPELEETRAGVVLVPVGLEVARKDLSLLRCENPNAAFSRLVELFAGEGDRPDPGVHSTAVIGAGCELGDEVSIGANCVLGDGVKLGPGAILRPGVVLGRGVEVGASSELHPGVVLYAGVRVGARCLLHAGAVLGSDGFGFDPTAEGWAKIPQCGTVVVEDEVEIGANCTIDRGRFGPTRIGRGAKLDNLVHIAHNVQVGEGALLIAQVGIAGSSRIGRRAILAGQVGVAGHLNIGDGVRVGAQSGIGKDLPPNTDHFGSPSLPHGERMRVIAAAPKLPGLVRRMKTLERRLGELERALESTRSSPERTP